MTAHQAKLALREPADQDIIILLNSLQKICRAQIMLLSEICIKRPVLATVLSLIIIVFGILGYSHLETRYFPNVSNYTVDVSTSYPGASAQLIETSINSILEDALSGIGGIDSLTSSAMQDSGDITITFKPNVNFTEKADEVRDKVANARGLLPSNLDPPNVTLSEDTDMLMDVAFTDDKLSPPQIRDYINRYIKDQLQQVPGVGSIIINGSNDYAMRIWLDPQKMAAHNITAADVKNTISNNNIELPAGKFKSTTMNFPINEDTQLHSVQEFNNLSLNNTTHISDIGRAELGLADDPTIIRLNGQPAIDLGIYTETGANPLAVSKAIHTALNNLQSSLPSSMQLKVSYDIASFLQASVDEVYKAIFFATICVLGIIFLSLGSGRSVLIPIITIPICVIGVFGFIALMGYSINILTLLAIVLAVGLVVDDAVVVLENVHRHLEKGAEPAHAATIGTREITFAVIAMTLTLVAVYAPIGFLSNKAALIFQEFAFTLAAAVLLSGFVALTLTPSLCALLLKANHTSPLTHKIDQFFVILKLHYLQFLTKVFQHRSRIVWSLIAIAVLGIFIFKSLPAEFAPDEDMGIVIGSLTSPTGSNVNYTYNYLQKVENIFDGIPERDSLLSIAGIGTGETSELYLFLKPQEERSRSANDIGNALSGELQQIPGVTASAFALAPFRSMANHGIQFDVLTTASYMALNSSTQSLLTHLKTYPGLVNPNSSVKFDSQQYNITINRDLANNVGVNTRDIDDTLATFLGGSYINDYYVGNQSYKVIAQADLTNIRQPSDITKFYVRGNNNNLIPLDNLITITSVLQQQSLEHYDRLRSATLSADIAPGYNIKQVMDWLNQNVPHLLNSDTKFTYIGAAKDLSDSSQSVGIIFILALVFIYLVLAAQFESFIDPFIVMLTVPLCIVGALAVLWLTGGSLNLYTGIGLVTLIGLVTKHGILITQFANQLRAEGHSVNDAIHQAAAIRLRPILMTTGAMTLGALPLALATGTGAASRSQIGWVIVGGLLLGTFFSLVIVPVAYTFFARFKKVI